MILKSKHGKRKIKSKILDPRIKIGTFVANKRK